MKHAGTIDTTQPVHYLSGDTLTLYPFVLLLPAEAYGDAVQSDGTLPIAAGVRPLLMPHPPTCSVCGNGPAVVVVEGWEAEGTEGAACFVCLMGSQGTVTDVANVEGVEAW